MGTLNQYTGLWYQNDHGDLMRYDYGEVYNYRFNIPGLFLEVLLASLLFVYLGQLLASRFNCKF